jgi:hypothetical protein
MRAWVPVRACRRGPEHALAGWVLNAQSAGIQRLHPPYRSVRPAHRHSRRLPGGVDDRCRFAGRPRTVASYPSGAPNAWSTPGVAASAGLIRTLLDSNNVNRQ